jgi:hypothetical protein
MGGVSFIHSVEAESEIHLSFYPLVNVGFFPVSKSSGVEVENTRSYTSTSPYDFMVK